MQRQAINVSIMELKNLIKELESEQKDFEKDIKLKLSVSQRVKHEREMLKKKWLIPIINYSDASDTWVFDRVEDKE